MGLVLSCDYTPLSHEGTSTPVWEHTVALVRYTLQQAECARHPSFETNEEVMLDAVSDDLLGDVSKLQRST